MLIYFNDLKAFDKAVEMCDEILKLAPGDANMLKYRDQFQKKKTFVSLFEKAKIINFFARKY